MWILSLNVIGFGGLAKQRTLVTLFRSLSPYMVLLQETMCSHYPALLDFPKLLPGWEFRATSAEGLSSGLLTGWNPRSVHSKSFETLVVILVKAHFRNSFVSFSVFNCYGPYRDHDILWNRVEAGGLLR